MSTRQLEKRTVPALRDRCRKAKLPVYQHHGKRLVKRDLVAALAQHSKRRSKHRKPAAVRPPQPSRDRRAAIVATLAEQLTRRALVDRPCDPVYARTHHRIIRGGKAAKDRSILQRKRLVAIGEPRDGAPDEDGRAFWADKRVVESNIAT
ncbi:MAG: hypothetical protein HQ581_13145 [Planctomycetes bacterium]|nr:hypothetical protein [Planctomycetota bacterium]